jgi:hypothetical protein
VYYRTYVVAALVFLSISSSATAQSAPTKNKTAAIAAVRSEPVSQTAQPTGPAQTAAAPPETLGEMLARQGTVVLKVPNYDSARRSVTDMSRDNGGETLEVHTYVDGKGRKYGWLTFRLPADRLTAVIPVVKGVGILYSEKVASADNISLYEELARRVLRLQQHEQRLSGILASPRRMRGSDILFLQERLFRASVDESLLSQQRVDLERASRSATLLVSLFEPGTFPSPRPAAINLTGRFRAGALVAHEALMEQAARASTALAYIVTYAPLWIPALVLGVILLIMVWRNRLRLLAVLDFALRVVALRLIVKAVSYVRDAWAARHEPLSVGWAAPGSGGSVDKADREA